jgi:ABC-type antimicrobial peptide transport system permease subunit
VATVVPGSAIHWTGTMAGEVALEYAPARFYSMLVGSFSAGAVLLSGVGLFALLWHTASSRIGEMGLRSALGASRTRIAALILLAGSRPLAVGSAVGLLGALWCGDWLRGFLYGVEPLDPTSLALAVVLVSLVGVAASLVPARRAASVDPLVALKTE